jgi:NAD(P)-dependent dehydrogenase (short-subunit alcohol dehydrogenase family)
MARVAVITGAAGGIGRAAVDLFHSASWYVVGIDRVGEDATNADRFVEADVSDEASLKAAIESLRDLGHIDALVNNAAVSQSTPLVDTSSAEWDEIMATNVRAAFLAIRYAHALMRDRGGSIVNISSVHAVATAARVASYATSKGALVALTRASALELAPDAIRVNAILPGAVDTSMLRRDGEDEDRIRSIAARTPLGRVANPGEIAQAILFLADEERSSFITGEALVVDGGALAKLSTE